MSEVIKIPFIEGDGIGVDITPVMKKVVDATLKNSYGDSKKIEWIEVFAGEKSFNKYKDDSSKTVFEKWLPTETFDAFSKYKVGIKGPLTTPVGEGFRSLNVAIRQKLDLYACIRPVKWMGSPSPVKEPQNVDMIIFRENSEDIYAGIEFNAGTVEVKKVIDFLQDEMGVKKIRFPKSSSIGIKPVSKEGTIRLVRKAVEYAIDNDKPNITIVHKGNIMKFTEGGFLRWSNEFIKDEYGAKEIDGGPWLSFKNPKSGKEIVFKNSIADAFLQQILLRPAEYSVIATLNLNGDYVSDALAATIGGIGIAPGANLNDTIGIFEATHGTAPKHAGKDQVNPLSLILSAEMMLRHLKLYEAADKLIAAITKAMAGKELTYDFARQVDGSKEVSCSRFGDIIIENL